MKWRVPFRSVAEAEAIIEAPTRREALEKFWARQWDEQTDLEVVRITKTGPAIQETEPPR